MNKKRIVLISLCITIIASALGGCSFVMPGMPKDDVVNTTEQTDENTITTLGLEPDLNYERPVVEAHIEVDQLGYLSNQRKLAIFRGEDLSKVFRVVSASDGSVVYTGTIESKMVNDTNESYYFGDFSDFTTPGEYYIQTDVIGYSYKFSINDNIYDGLLRDSMKQFYLNRCGYSLTATYAGENAHSACHTENVSLRQDANTELDVSGGWHMDSSGDRVVIKGCDTVEALLMAYEYNTAVFGDDEGIPESGDNIPDILNEIVIEIDWLLKMQDQSTGAVYKAVSVVDKGLDKANPCHIEDPDMSSTLYFASTMAYFSYLYQTYDTQYATKCLQAADRAMKYAAKFKDTLNPDEYFRAAAMMYRATGYYNYRDIVANYMNNNSTLNLSSNVVFAGCVTYLATKQKTQKAYCDIMMKSLKDFAVDLSGRRGDYIYLVGEELQETDNSVLLSEIARLTVVNYVISSNEYEVLMEKYMHYFLGCNPNNICYIGQYNSTNKQTAQDILKQPVSDAYFVLLMSGVELSMNSGESWN